MDAVKPSVYDKTGRPILPGDTLKVYHYRARLRRERRYMYKYVTGYHESGKALVVDHLQPGSTPYWLLLDGKTKQDIEIVQGFAGVPGGCDFRDRKPIDKPTADTVRRDVGREVTQ
jgi:hypothetical protein